MTVGQNRLKMIGPKVRNRLKVASLSESNWSVVTTSRWIHNSNVEGGTKSCDYSSRSTVYGFNLDVSKKRVKQLLFKKSWTFFIDKI